jgi:hypothetical protein
MLFKLAEELEFLVVKVWNAFIGWTEGREGS